MSFVDARRTAVWISLAIFACFVPLLEVLNVARRGDASAPIGYIAIAAIVEYVAIAAVGYKVTGILESREARWIRNALAFSLVSVAAIAILLVRHLLELSFYGQGVDSTSAPMIIGVVAGNFLWKDVNSKDNVGTR